MTKNQEYALQYADYAMAQMRRYGIPASVTLAQGILESSNGQSRLARNENNHFGIKATSSWIAEGGKYGIYTDDKPNEKFCSYDSVGDSYEHHSRFLKENSRYAGCFKLSPDDYKGWAQSIEKAGYATGGKYAENLQKIIEQNGLQKYDRQVMQEMTAQGRQFGVEHNPLQTSESAEHGTGYSFPVEREEFLFITSPFGTRQDPLDSTKQQMHKGVDIRCKADAVLATESGGKVVAVNQNKNTPGGKSLTVEYARTDGSKVQCTYMHLKEISVKVGDTVQAGGRLGAALVLVVIAAVGHRIKDIMVILILGMMFSSGVGAIVQILQYLSKEESLKAFVIWTMGSLGDVTFDQLAVLVPSIIAGLLLAVVTIKPLNLLLFGEEYAVTMGLNIRRSRGLLFLSTTLLAGTVTAFCGPIGFIGLAMPHVTRMLFRNSDHRVLVPGTVLSGAAVLLLCDLVSKMFTLPINAITALLGIPIVVWVVLRNKSVTA